MSPPGGSFYLIQKSPKFKKKEKEKKNKTNIEIF